jgi:hypothetical protein
VPVAAVAVAVRAQGGEDGLGVRAVEEQLEAAPIEDTGVAGHEAARGNQVITHRPTWLRVTCIDGGEKVPAAAAIVRLLVRGSDRF